MGLFGVGVKSLRHVRRPINSFGWRHSRHTVSPVYVHAPYVPGLITQRQANRELPAAKLGWQTSKTLYLSLATFLAAMVLTAYGFFNREKLTSSVVTSTMYALRHNKAGRDVLGSNIEISGYMPIVWGSIDQLHGKIDIQLRVCGSRSAGLMKFLSIRKQKDGFFEILEWSLTMDDGRVVNLLEDDSSNPATIPGIS